MNKTSNLLILFGFIFLVFALGLIYQRYDSSRISFNISEVKAQSFYPYKVISPTEISINTQKIHLPIYPAHLTQGKWEVNSRGVSFLDSSPIPGEKGNSILYGHNWPALLGNLTKVKINDEIVIKYSDGSTKSFKVIKTEEVNPNQSEVLSQTKDNRLTIYTCTGFLDNKRFVVTATI